MLKNAKLQVHIVYLHKNQFPRSYIESSNTKQRVVPVLINMKFSNFTFNNAIMDIDVTFIIVDISVYNTSFLHYIIFQVSDILVQPHCFSDSMKAYVLKSVNNWV